MYMKVRPPEDYQNARERFRSYLPRIQDRWDNARLDSVNHPAEDDLSIDWIRADASDEKKKLLLLTTGEHGVEGYVGAVMLNLFMEEFLSGLNPRDTGLILVHPINPWGMKHKRRTNHLSVDLNRNFLESEESFRIQANPGYARLHDFLNPGQRLRGYRWAKAAFLFRLLWTRLAMGRETLQHATLLGQYQFPRGIYYGGLETQFETGTMKRLFRTCVKPYDQVVHVDIHTGYGPRDQMTMVNSPLEPLSPSLWKARLDYPRIVAADPGEFYSIQGDMIDWVYSMIKHEYPGKRYFGTAFEFGTVGEGLSASIHSLRTMILENQAYWHGMKNPEDADRLRKDYLHLYKPAEATWYEKAVQDARQAFEGILTAHGFLD